MTSRKDACGGMVRPRELPLSPNCALHRRRGIGKRTFGPSRQHHRPGRPGGCAKTPPMAAWASSDFGKRVAREGVRGKRSPVGGLGVSPPSGFARKNLWMTGYPQLSPKVRVLKIRDGTMAANTKSSPSAGATMTDAGRKFGTARRPGQTRTGNAARSLKHHNAPAKAGPALQPVNPTAEVDQRPFKPVTAEPVAAIAALHRATVRGRPIGFDRLSRALAAT